jgi:hypothetical protein
MVGWGMVPGDGHRRNDSRAGGECKPGPRGRLVAGWVVPMHLRIFYQETLRISSKIWQFRLFLLKRVDSA